MMTRVAYRLFVAVMVMGVGVSARQSTSWPATRRDPQVSPARDPRAPTSGATTVQGRIVAVDSGRPLRRVAVRLSASERKTQYVVLTGPEGQFEFSDIAPGRYSLSASKAGYVTTQLGARRPGEAGRRFDVAPGQVMDNVHLALIRAGAIHGRIVDDFGEPVADAVITAHRYRQVGTRRRMVPAGKAGQSDDEGGFRIFGLQPGEYYLSAVVRGGGVTPEESGAAEPVGYAPTYYPGVPSPAAAQPINVQTGHTSQADIQLLSVRVARASGVVLDSTGNPVARGVVMAHSLDGAGSGTLGRLGPQGAFVLTGLAPGSYELVARAEPGPTVHATPLPASPPPPEAGILSLSIAGADVSDLVISTSRGNRVAGQLIFENGLPPADQILVSAAPQRDGPIVGAASARVGPTGAFTLDGVMGPVRIHLTPPKGWMVKAISYGEIDVTESAIDFGRAARARLRVVMTNRLTTVVGTVRNADGTVAADCDVLILPQDAERLRRADDAARAVVSDQHGAFKIEGLRPGAYLAIAPTAGDDDERFEPDYIDRIRRQATAFELNEGENRVLALVRRKP